MNIVWIDIPFIEDMLMLVLFSACGCRRWVGAWLS